MHCIIYSFEELDKDLSTEGANLLSEFLALASPGSGPPVGGGPLEALLVHLAASAGAGTPGLGHLLFDSLGISSGGLRVVTSGLVTGSLLLGRTGGGHATVGSKVSDSLIVGAPFPPLTKGNVKFKSGCSSFSTRLQLLQLPQAVFVSHRSTAESFRAIPKGSSPAPP